MSNRGVFALSATLMVLFFLASNFDHYFFALHFLEAIIYVAVLLLLFYGVEDWAYVIAFVTPLYWIILTLLNGTLLRGLVSLGRVFRFQPVEYPIGLVVGLVFLVSVVLLIVSLRAFWHEVWGRPGAVQALVGAALVVTIYWVMMVWVALRMVAPVS